MSDRLTLFERVHHLHRAWRYRLRSERDELAFMRRCDLAGRTAVDIGAHRGIYSWWMHRAVGPAGRVVAFEPQPEMLEHLGRLKRSFHLDRLTIEASGLSSAPGRMQLVRETGHSGGARLDPTGATAQRGAAASASGAARAIESFDVPITTLDDYFAAHGGPPVAFIKCDVEGHESAVFEGGRELLQRDRPALLVEIHDRRVREGTLVRFLNELDYEAFFPHRGRLVPMSEFDTLRPTIGKAYLNYIFRPAVAMEAGCHTPWQNRGDDGR